MINIAIANNFEGRVFLEKLYCKIYGLEEDEIKEDRTDPFFVLAVKNIGQMKSSVRENISIYELEDADYSIGCKKEAEYIIAKEATKVDIPPCNMIMKIREEHSFRRNYIPKNGAFDGYWNTRGGIAI